MDMGGADMRSGLWVALGCQPGVSAWYAVWLLSRLSPPAPKEPQNPNPASAPAARQARRVRAGTGFHREHARP